MLLLGRTALSPSVSCYRFRVPGAALFGWVPGQYVELYAPASPDEALPYSIASAPDAERPSEFELAVGPGTTGDPFTDLPVGSELELAGPFGRLLWSPLGSTALMIGVGTGVAPLRALTQATLHHTPEQNITLLCGFRSESDVLWRSEFERLQSRVPNFHYAVTLTQPSPGYPGLHGRVQAHVLELAAGLPEPTVFLCGKTAMVQECQRLLEEGADIPPHKIFAEGY